MALDMTLPKELDRNRLRAVASGQAYDLPRLAAIRTLAVEGDSADTQLFARLVADEREEPRVRQLALTGLYRMHTPEAHRAMRQLAEQISDERLLGELAQRLGRIGDAAARDLLLGLARRTRGWSARQARFAADLIAYRLDLPGEGLPAPRRDELASVDGLPQAPIALHPAEPLETMLCLEALAAEPYGVSYASAPVYRMDCGRNPRMIVFNRDFVGPAAAERLAGRKALAGVVASRVATNRYSTILLLLSAPAANGDQLVLHAVTPDGGPAYAGFASVGVGAISFSFEALARPGVAPAHVAGRFDGEKLALDEARAALVVRERRRPQPGIGP